MNNPESPQCHTRTLTLYSRRVIPHVHTRYCVLVTYPINQHITYYVRCNNWYDIKNNPHSLTPVISIIISSSVSHVHETMIFISTTTTYYYYVVPMGRCNYSFSIEKKDALSLNNLSNAQSPNVFPTRPHQILHFQHVLLRLPSWQAKTWQSKPFLVVERSDCLESLLKHTAPSPRPQDDAFCARVGEEEENTVINLSMSVI